MGFLNSSEQKSRTIALFDIGSGSIGGALVVLSEDQYSLPTIIKSARIEIAYRDSVDFDLLLTDMKKTLHACAQELYNHKIGKLDKIVCTLASPWYVSETRLLKMSRDRAFTFTNKIADDLLKKEITALQDNSDNRYNNKGDTHVIEHHVIGVTLDNSPVEHPLEKQTKSVEMNMVISLSPKVCINTITDTLAHVYHDTPVRFQSFMLASYLAVRDKYTNIHSYMLIDIGAKITDVSIVRRGILTDSVSFPFGTNTFYSQLKDNSSLEFRDAKELFNLYTTNSLESKQQIKLEKIITRIEDSFRQSLKECLHSLPHSKGLPGTIFLTTDTPFQDWFSKIISTQEQLAALSTDGRVTVVTIDGPEFLNMCTVKGGICDPFLMVEAIALVRRSK